MTLLEACTVILIMMLVLNVAPMLFVPMYVGALAFSLYRIIIRPKRFVVSWHPLDRTADVPHWKQFMQVEN